jgi:fructosamine-3-kinase
MHEWVGVAAAITEATGSSFLVRRCTGVGGGCINNAVLLEDGDRRYFVKLNSAARAEMFAAEAEGLSELSRARAVRVPQPVCHGIAGDQAFLALEYLDLQAADETAQERLGRELAALHRTTRPRFGWGRDNTIGSTLQSNRPADDWLEFWRAQRLGFQIDLAGRNGYGRGLAAKGERLAERLGDLFGVYRPVASLLHGDLWAGNVAATSKRAPVLFDPAVYFGDRETDLAMTELFGGFSRRFYDAYREAWPLDPGYEVRRVLYNLYHVLNHLNLFGGAYLAQADRMLDRLLAEVA